MIRKYFERQLKKKIEAALAKASLELPAQARATLRKELDGLVQMPPIDSSGAWLDEVDWVDRAEQRYMDYGLMTHFQARRCAEKLFKEKSHGAKIIAINPESAVDEDINCMVEDRRER